MYEHIPGRVNVKLFSNLLGLDGSIHYMDEINKITLTHSLSQKEQQQQQQLHMHDVP